MVQLLALMKKNWILWKKGLLGSILEVVVMLVFAGLLVLIHSLQENTDKAKTSYLRAGVTYDLVPPASVAALPFPDDFVAYHGLLKEFGKSQLVK